MPANFPSPSGQAEVQGHKLTHLRTERERGGTGRSKKGLGSTGRSERGLGSTVGSIRGLGGTVRSMGGSLLLMEVACMGRDLLCMKERHLQLG